MLLKFVVFEQLSMKCFLQTIETRFRLSSTLNKRTNARLLTKRQNKIISTKGFLDSVFHKVWLEKKTKKNRRSNREFKMPRRRRRQERQKSNRFHSKNKTEHVQHTRVYISSLSLPTMTYKCVGFMFYVGRDQATTRFFFSF